MGSHTRQHGSEHLETKPSPLRQAFGLEIGRGHAKIVHAALALDRFRTLPVARLSWLNLSTDSDNVQNTTQDLGSQTDSAGFLPELSRQQNAVAEFPTSLFIQGRSGTGKTLVLVQRLLVKRAAALLEQGTSPSQLFVTKSSMLKNDVCAKLKTAKCPVSVIWPPEGVVCCTWQQLVSLLLPHKESTINFDVFLSRYWPALGAKRTHLSPKIVWTEFNTRLRPFGHEGGLSLFEYSESDVAATGVRISREDQRAVHSMLHKYTEMKFRFHELDDIDISVLLQRALSNVASHVDEVYIDEVQDFSPSELFSLLKICPADGVTIAGDTCQTINPGSAFSFKDIIMCFHGHKGFGRLKRVDASNFAWDNHMHLLRYNYRCSAGVAALASSVARLLLQRFPHSADHIDEDTCMQQAVKMPLVVEVAGRKPGTFIMGSSVDASPFSNPWQMVILVRNEASRQALRYQGVDGIILTVVEAKGLEFETVIICNLLGDTPIAEEIWALASEESAESEVAMFAAREDGHFILTKLSEKGCHTAMAIQEFKLLYVAITRARVGCVILEVGRDPACWAPLIRRWEQEGVVQRWCGMQRYILEATPRQGDAPSSPTQSSNATFTPPPEPSTSITVADMIQWLDEECEQRIGRHERKARAALKKEIQRLECSGEVDISFCAAFAASNQIYVEPSFEWRGLSRDTPAADNDVDCDTEIPSLQLMMKQRYPSKDAVSDVRVSVRQLYGAGTRLLMHATDMPQERLHVFKEAHQILLRGLAAADEVLNIQLRNGGAQEAPLEVLPKATTQLLQQVSAVMQEVSRQPSWRGRSTLASVPSLTLWKRIFSFLTPCDQLELQSGIDLVATRIREHARFHQEIRSAALLAKAWCIFCDARYNSKAEQAEACVLVDASQKVLQSLRKFQKQVMHDRKCERHLMKEVSCHLNGAKQRLPAKSKDFRIAQETIDTLQELKQLEPGAKPDPIQVLDNLLASLGEAMSRYNHQCQAHYPESESWRCHICDKQIRLSGKGQQSKQQFYRCNLCSLHLCTKCVRTKCNTMEKEYYESFFYEPLRQLQKIKDSLKKRQGSTEAKQWVAELYCKLELLGPIHAALSDVYATAGRAFWAAGHPRLAIDALNESVSGLEIVPKLAQSAAEILGEDRPATLLCSSLESQSAVYARQAASCWLLVPYGLHDTCSPAQAWQEAEKVFARCSLHWEAAQCAAHCGSMRKVLTYLAFLDGPRAIGFGLLCAAILFEEPAIGSSFFKKIQNISMLVSRWRREFPNLQHIPTPFEERRVTSGKEMMPRKFGNLTVSSTKYDAQSKDDCRSDRDPRLAGCNAEEDMSAHPCSETNSHGTVCDLPCNRDVKPQGHDAEDDTSQNTLSGNALPSIGYDSLLNTKTVAPITSLSSVPESTIPESVATKKHDVSDCPADEILTLFKERGLPLEAAQRLTDPDGEFAYENLIDFAQVVTVEDLRSAGLKVAPARLLRQALSVGGEIYNNLVVAGRLRPTKAEPPKMGEPSDFGNPNDGSSTSELTGSSSGSTKMTSVMIPQRVRDKVKDVAPQLYEQDKLAELCGRDFSTLRGGMDEAHSRGVLDMAEVVRLQKINQSANNAKHANFGQGHSSHSSKSASSASGINRTG